MPDPRIRLVSTDEFQLLLREFLDDRELGERSARTIDWYESNLGRFGWWLRETNASLSPAEHDPRLLREFLRYLQSAEVRWNQPDHSSSTRPMTAGGRDTYDRCLRAFYRWLVHQEYIARSPMDKIPRPKKPGDDQPDPFTTQELARIAATLIAKTGPLAERNRSIVAVLLDVGLRVSELCALTSADVDLGTGDLIVQHGKGGYRRTVRLGARGRRVVRRYWNRYREDLGAGPLFYTRDLRPISRNVVRLMLDDVGTVAGVEPINPHRFRHTAAVSAVRAGMDLFQLQHMLGHRSLEMTRRYVKLASIDMETAARDHSPLDHLKLPL